MANQQAHIERLTRALRSLTGLSVGDSFGECFFTPDVRGHISSKGPMEAIAKRVIPCTTCPHFDKSFKYMYTDDTEMALGLLEVLLNSAEESGNASLVGQEDKIAWAFARNYREFGSPYERSYGGGAYVYLCQVLRDGYGKNWLSYASEMFDGKGSYGNGGAMRVAPIGAYFADSPVPVIISEARASSRVTHKNIEGQHGAIAIALAAAYACQHQVSLQQQAPVEQAERLSIGIKLVDFVIQNMPDEQSETRNGINKIRKLLQDEVDQNEQTCTVDQVVKLVGNGSKVSAQDTVPFCMWIIGKYLFNFEDAMWNCVSALGDRDTTCAIVGGVISCVTGISAIPREWLVNREPLKIKHWPKLPQKLLLKDIYQDHPTAVVEKVELTEEYFEQFCHKLQQEQKSE